MRLDAALFFPHLNFADEVLGNPPALSLVFEKPASEQSSQIFKIIRQIPAQTLPFAFVFHTPSPDYSNTIWMDRFSVKIMINFRGLLVARALSYEKIWPSLPSSRFAAPGGRGLPAAPTRGLRPAAGEPGF
jgi:hypothetical protein